VDAFVFDESVYRSWNSDGDAAIRTGAVLACAAPASRVGSLHDSTSEEIWNGAAFQEPRRRVNSVRPPLLCAHYFAYRKPGNADGVFMHRLTDGYDLLRDLADNNYAYAFRNRFSFAQACSRYGRTIAIVAHKRRVRSAGSAAGSLP
jgi:hypothetical protein